MIAYATAEEYDIKALQARLESQAADRTVWNLLGEAIWVPSNEGELFVFESGQLRLHSLGTYLADEQCREPGRLERV